MKVWCSTRREEGSCYECQTRDSDKVICIRLGITVVRLCSQCLTKLLAEIDDSQPCA